MAVPLLDLRAQHATIRDETVAAVLRIVDAQTFILGDAVLELERAVAALSHTKHAIGCANGTDAILLAMRALDIGRGDEVITTPFTFFATAGTIHNVGATPVFVDIEPKTFNIRPDANAKAMADKDEVEIRLYRIIYDCIEEMELALKGMLEPKFKEVILGNATVRQTFRVTGAGTIAGCYIKSGKITRSAEVRLIRDSVVVYEGKIDSLKRFKDDAKEVTEGYECGIGLDKFNDIKEGDVIEAFVKEQI
jgi:hypothetical protein